MGWSSTGGRTSVNYTSSFTNAALSTGILTVNHNLGSMYAVPVVWDGDSKIISPDDFTAVTLNQMTVDLTSFGTLVGTWNICILSTGSQISYPITIANGGTGQSNTAELGKVLTGNGTTYEGEYHVKTNLLTNSQWMAMSGSTVCERISGAAPVTDGANAALVNNLLTNGGFDSVTTSWTACTDAGTVPTLASSATGKTGNGLSITFAASSTGAGAFQSFTTVIGKLYQASAYCKKGTATNCVFVVGTAGYPNAGYYNIGQTAM